MPAVREDDLVGQVQLVELLKKRFAALLGLHDDIQVIEVDPGPPFLPLCLRFLETAVMHEVDPYHAMGPL